MQDDIQPQPGNTDVHFCVFIHGLWGNPGHLTQISKTLQTKFADSGLHILVAKRNVGNFTYDGIELGAERVTKEIEDEFAELEKQNNKITKISVVGYSLGGLIARYSIGLLLSKGYFDRMEPINFSTFATPHLGTRTPLLGWHNQVFNNLGSRTLSASGQQLWGTDDFQSTGRSILSVLADPNSIFIRALNKFKHRSLYANIVNDRAVPFYTACIEDIDPFIDIDGIDINYVPDLDDVILQHPYGEPPSTLPMAAKKTTTPTYLESFTNGARNAANKAPFYVFLTVLGPIGASVYFANAGIQSFKSATRIQDHAEGKSGIEKGRYKVQLMLEGAQRHAEQMMEELTPKHAEYLPEGEDGRHKHEKQSEKNDERHTNESKEAQQKETGPPQEVKGQAQSDLTDDESSKMNGHSVSGTTSTTDLSRRDSQRTKNSTSDTAQTTPISSTVNGNALSPTSAQTTTHQDDALAYGEDVLNTDPSNDKSTSGTAFSPPPDTLPSRHSSNKSTQDNDNTSIYPDTLSSRRSDGENPDFPTLALTPEQFKMKESLDAVGWRKYPVHIKRANHSHAAIIVRMQRPGFGEGRTVAKHWVERFEI